MDAHSARTHRFACGPAVAAQRASAALASIALSVALALPSTAATDTTAWNRREDWPAAIHARYRLRWEGIKVGRLNIESKFTANSYEVTGYAKVSVLFGKFKWWGTAKVSGGIAEGIPQPVTYSLAWHQRRKKKDISIHVGFKDRIATDIAVKPPPKVRHDTVPLLPPHKAGVFDPLSALIMLTKAGDQPPCKRRIGVFDGKQRYDIVLAPKRLTHLPGRSGNGKGEAAHVCRITYEPVAGHRANADTRSYAANRKAEIVMRRVPGTMLLIPYSVTIPTSWGTASLVTDRVKVVTTAGKYVFK